MIIPITDIDFVALSLASLMIGVLGFVIFFNNTKSSTHKFFLAFSLFTIIYGFFNYLNYQVAFPGLVLIFLRLTLFFAVWHAFSFFLLFYSFPFKNIKYANYVKYLVFPIVIITSGLTLTPLVFKNVETVISTGVVTNPERGPAIALFGIVSIGLLLLGFYYLIKKVHNAEKKQKFQYYFIVTGVLITFSSIILFNVVLPIVFDNVTFVPLAPVFILPFILLTGYAIIKHHLLNIKVITAEFFVFALLILSLFEVITSSTLGEKIIKIIGLILFFVVGIYLIRNVRKEVEQKEELAKLSDELTKANTKLKKFDEAKTEFLSITSHQLRTPLSSIKGYLSMIIEGDFGDFNKEQGKSLNRVYNEVERLIRLVQVFLNVSRIESGRLKIAQVDFDITELIADVIDQLKPIADEKNLQLEFEKSIPELPYVGDPDKLKDVVVNLVDNAIKYTKEGRVWVTTELTSNHVLIKVHDTGVGIDPDYAEHLFEKFSRAKGIAQLDAGGSGLGLFIVKKIIEGHGGSIHASSEGEGRGATFTVTLPVNNSEQTS